MDSAFITGSPGPGAAGRGRGSLRGTRCRLRRDDLLLGADLGGTFLFGIEGALAAIDGHLDLMGVMVLAFATALAGWIIRDVQIGDALKGTVTAVGGGVVRDVLLAQVPGVLRTDIYAMAAPAGSVVVLCGRRMELSAETASAIGGILCFALRLAGVWQHWRLPVMAP